MSKTHLFVTDQHAHYEHDNHRATLLSKLIQEVKPDVLIFGGDLVDMPSLSSYDRGKKSFEGRTYRADIESGNEFLDLVFSPLKKAKKKLPYSVFLEGNHEHRIKRAINLQPELDGTIDLFDLNLDENFDEIIEYEGGTPGIINLDGINYAHYFVSGVNGKPIGGERPAYSLLSKQLASCTVGHVHTVDYHVRTTADHRRLHGLVGGCFFDYNSDWAGNTNPLYWRGCIVKSNVENGDYDPHFISLRQLERRYG